MLFWQQMNAVRDKIDIIFSSQNKSIKFFIIINRNQGHNNIIQAFGQF